MTFPVLDGKVALVTGAAMGMGEATARLFAEAGAKVLVADLNEERGRAVTEEIVADGGTATFFKVNVADSAQVRAMVQAAVDTYGRLDAAVNNAALSPDAAPTSEFDEDYWDRLMAVDLKGTALCLKWELRQLIEQGGGGSLINISSVSGFRPQPENPAYVAAKQASTASPRPPPSRTAPTTSASTRSRRAPSTRRCCAVPWSRTASPRSSSPRSSACSAASGSRARSPRPACGSPPTSRRT